MYVSNSKTYQELVSIVETVVKYDVDKYSADLQCISMVSGTTCRTFIRNVDYVQFMLGEDRVIPPVCVSVIERVEGGFIGEEISRRDNTQQFQSSSGIKQLFPESRENLCGVPPEFNHHYNDFYNDINNEQNSEPNVRPTQQMDDEENLHSVDNVANNEEEKMAVEPERRATRVQIFTYSAAVVAGTSEVRPNLTTCDSDNVKTWVIPGAQSYSFGISGSVNSVQEEPTSMIYKGQIFPTKKDLKRLVRHFAIRQNFEWKVKRLTFKLLPSFGYRLEQQNPWTITDLQCDEDDGTHLKGRFGGTMIVATAQDGNKHMYPIAFGYGDSKNNLSWEWFLDCLKGALGHIDDLVFISDRHASIEAGISNVFPDTTHTICCWNMLRMWFYDRHCTTQSMRHQLIDAAHIVILKRVEKCGYMTFNPVDWNIFFVKRSRMQWTVDLARETCTCNKFQMDMFPCSHALAGARERNLDYTSQCADFYKRQTLIDAYSVPIMPVGHPSEWIVPTDIVNRVVLNPLSRRKAGCPMRGRHASSSERTTTQSCRICGELGHNARQCHNPPLINNGPSRIVQAEYRHKCSICHSVGHNKQTCPDNGPT
ncbi:hypothetical protein Ddye_013146 [Dipteronia dyeriana]|uniref:SWIM-type domain-containing protein n=1 Tax=Dipteronia dyeriana TaxID=168575 RepID=A0AAE0CJC9_9ROSI|nr:hypothetical protein Ddye_013146 [Dipteronia dyeriana]